MQIETSILNGKYLCRYQICEGNMKLGPNKDQQFFKPQNLVLKIVRTLHSQCRSLKKIFKKAIIKFNNQIFLMNYHSVFLPISFTPQQLSIDPTSAYFSIFPNPAITHFYNPTLYIPVQNLLPSVNQTETTQKDHLHSLDSKQSICHSDTCQRNWKQKISNEEQNPSNGVSTPQRLKPISKSGQDLKIGYQEQLEEDGLENDENISQQYVNNPENLSSYPKKNTQSNMVNQIFSYVSNQGKSKEIVQKYFQKDNKKVIAFYQILKDIKKRKKKYINRKYLATLCTIKENEVGYKMLLRARNKMNALRIPQFQRLLSFLIIHYLNKEAEINIITSKKINRITCKQHLERRREIKNYLIQKFIHCGLQK